MATYYVSTQRGSNSNNGTSQLTPWLTLTYAATMVAAGDTVYIGSGIYRENVSLSTAGTADAHVQWKGDPTCRYLTSDKPGRVHVTSYNTSWVEQTGPTWSFNSKAYNDLYDMTLDGSSGDGVTGYANTTLTRCNVQAKETGVNGATILYDCYVSGGLYGVQNAYTYRCVLSSGGSAARYGQHGSTVAVAGDCGFESVAQAINCTAVGGEFGYYQSVCYNCTAMNSYRGFYGSGLNTTLYNCSAVQCDTGFYGTDAANALNLANSCMTHLCHALRRGGTYESGDPTAGASVHYDWFDLSRVLEPWYTATPTSGLRNTGHATVYQDADILQRERPLGNGTCDRGAWEYADYDVSYVSGEYQTFPPSWKCHRAAQQVLYIPAEKDKTVDVTLQVRHTGTADNMKPQVWLRGLGVSSDQFNCTAASGVWQAATVSVVTEQDTVLELVLSAVDPATGAWAFFSDIHVTASPVSESNIEYGSALAASTASVTCTGTVIAGGGSSGKQYGQPYASRYSANFNWLDDNTTQYGLVFRAPFSGALDRTTICWKVSSGYGFGDYGLYEWQLRAVDANRMPTGAALLTESSWSPPTSDAQDATVNWSPTYSLVAGTYYCLTCRNTHASPSTNYSCPNTAQVEEGATSPLGWPTGISAETTNLIGGGYGDGLLMARVCYYSGSSWVQGWHNVDNPNFAYGNSGNGSISSLQLHYTGGQVYGHPYYSAHGGARAQLYGANRYAEYIPSWPYGTVTVVGIKAPWAVEGSANPADNLYYRIESGVTVGGNGTLVVQGTLSAPYAPTDTIRDGYYMQPWKSANFANSIQLTSGSSYRIQFYSPSSNSTNRYTQNVSYGDNDATYWNPVSWGGANDSGTLCHAQLSSDSGASWSAVNYYGDLAFLLFEA